MSFDNSQSSGSPHLPPADESHHKEGPREKCPPAEIDTDLPRMQDSGGERRSEPWLDGADGTRGAEEPGATGGRQQPQVLLFGVYYYCRFRCYYYYFTLRYLSTRESQHCPSLTPTWSEVAAKIMSTGNGQTKRTTLWKPRWGYFPLPLSKAAATAVTIETFP